MTFNTFLYVQAAGVRRSNKSVALDAGVATPNTGLPV